MTIQPLFTCQIQLFIFSKKVIKIIPASTVKLSVSCLFLHKIRKYIILHIFLFFHIIKKRRLKVVSVYQHDIFPKLYQHRSAFHCEKFLTAAIFFYLINDIAQSRYKSSSLFRHPHPIGIHFILC